MLRPKLGRRKRNSYAKMMKTLLIQNQQIIMQQQNMMFMVIKQFQPHQQTSTSTQLLGHHQQQTNQQGPTSHHQQNPLHQPQQQSSQQLSQVHQSTPSSSSQQQQQQQHHQHHQHQLHEHEHLQQSQQLQIPYSQEATNIVNSQQQMQQVATHLQENLGHYLTPAASEQDPISDDKQDDDDLATLMESDGLLHNNLLYNPQTDIGSITPYKGHQQHLDQTPSYYSSGCESLTTPRVEQPRQLAIANISQNVVKNLANSFKSPSKPKINVQILSGTATKNMKNSKAKIIQRMNISEFLRHVHPEKDD